MLRHWLWEPLRAYYARKRLERMQYEHAGEPGCVSARSGFRESAGPVRVEEDPDAVDWRLLGFGGKESIDEERESIRDKARQLADRNPYARNVLTLHRNYVVGVGMRHEVIEGESVRALESGSVTDRTLSRSHAQTLSRCNLLWREFLDANDWSVGNRKDWEFCVRTWRDGECFLRLFRQATWPPRIHFIDPENVAPDPKTGFPTAGIETMPGNVEDPLAYSIVTGEQSSASGVDTPGSEVVGADRILHTKIGVDANVKRGVSILLPVLEQMKRFEGWLEVELIHRKVASSIVLVRKHHSLPSSVSDFADAQATSVEPSSRLGGQSLRRNKILPGSIIDTQGCDLEFVSPNTHFDDAAKLGRLILLSIAAGTGLPEYMLTADAANANFSSTLVAEGPAMRLFAGWQAFFIGQWQKLFQMVMREAVFFGLLTADELDQVALEITPPELPSRNRYEEAQADAIYFDRGAISVRELGRRDGVDPDLMERESKSEIRNSKSETNSKPKAQNPKLI